VADAVAMGPVAVGTLGGDAPAKGAARIRSGPEGPRSPVAMAPVAAVPAGRIDRAPQESSLDSAEALP
jgi:hypothetical protein